MSNTAVGALYKRIIDTVIESSRTDFEENGIDHKTLEQLRESWQAKLSLGNRASFPWDPQPEASAPPPVAQSLPPQQSNAARNVQAPNSASSAISAPPPQASANPVAPIKQEASFEHSNPPNFLSLPNTGSYQSNAYSAQQRAAQLIHQQFGSQGQNSIGAMHAGIAQQNQIRQQQAQQAQQQASGQQQSSTPQQQQHSSIKQETVSSVGQAQTDGAADDAASRWDAIILKRNATGDDEPMGRIAADRFIRRQVEAMNSRLEAGGLLVPLDERHPVRQSKGKGKGKVRAHAAPAASSGPIANDAPGAAEANCRLPRQLDGPADDSDDGAYPDEEDDNDAINSDLDDPDDDLAEGIENGHEGDVILCLYDKVQRVKNKWKCTLKDGVVTIDGKDYVFHKAQGEFEW